MVRRAPLQLHRRQRHTLFGQPHPLRQTTTGDIGEGLVGRITSGNSQCIDHLSGGCGRCQIEHRHAANEQRRHELSEHH
jgi:hypothetical protein